jgi:hypothetical protein
MRFTGNLIGWGPPAPPKLPSAFEALHAARPTAHDALEDLFDTVWKAERDWAFNDFLDLALGIHAA